MDEELRRQLHDHIAGARWFGGKGRPFEVTTTRRLPITERVWIELVSLSYAGGGQDVYQLPVSAYPTARPDLAHALIAYADDRDLGQVHLYDALHDPAAVQQWVERFIGGESTREGLAFHLATELDLQPGAGSSVLTGEQSNSSVVLGDRALLKVFRRMVPGVNPDIELLRALTEDQTGVARLFGWLETGSDNPGEPLQLGLLQEFLVGAEDGWRLALDSIGAGADGFADEARRLGVAVAQVHAALAASFPVEQWDAGGLAQVAGAMAARLDRALRVVPQLEQHAPALRTLFDAVRRTRPPVPAQRVHGDLHLGQTLRTPEGWKIIDFEGEPAKPLAERRAPDVAWRDVAGMLRSFAYAGETWQRGGGSGARRWTEASTAAFLAGYGDTVPDTGTSPTGGDADQTLLRAYAADKAVYETVYEARNRPSWLPIPLSALARLTSPPG